MPLRNDRGKRRNWDNSQEPNFFVLFCFCFLIFVFFFVIYLFIYFFEFIYVANLEFIKGEWGVLEECELIIGPDDGFYLFVYFFQI